MHAIAGVGIRSLLSRSLLAISASAGFAIVPSMAQAKVHIAVDLDMQTIHVEAKDHTYDWKVSSGKTGYDTPAGSYKVLWMDKDHHSDEYEQAYMPNAIFFAPGFAIHGFSKSPWGHKASHGCVRMPMAQSALLFSLVKAEGADITITGVSDRVAPTVAEVEAKRAARADGTQAAGQPTDYAPRSTRASTAPRYYGGYDGYADAGYGSPYAGAGYGGYPSAPPPQPARGGLFGSFY